MPGNGKHGFPGGFLSQPQFQDLSVYGTAIRLMRAGKGEPLLVLRGPDASEGWREYTETLAQNFDVIAPEHPGFGNVEKPQWLDSMRDLASFYLDLIDTLDLKSVHVAGFDFGGWCAAEMAIRNPGTMASLTVAGAPGLSLPEAGGLDPFLRSEEDRFTDNFQDPAKAEAERTLQLTPETEDTRIANQMLIAQLAWNPRWHDPDLRKWLHRIRIPALIVWGAQDKVTPPAHGEEWQKLIPGARLETIAECGHVPQLEKPAELAALIAGFAGQQRNAA